jgi:hypothetical protein
VLPQMSDPATNRPIKSMRLGRFINRPFLNGAAFAPIHACCGIPIAFRKFTFAPSLTLRVRS